MIFQITDERDRILAVRKARSARACLEEYYKATLHPNGFSNPRYKSNTLSCRSQVGRRHWMAKKVA